MTGELVTCQRKTSTVPEQEKERKKNLVWFFFVGDVAGKVTGNAGTKNKVTSRIVDLKSRPMEWEV